MDDLISRRAAIEAIQEEINRYAFPPDDITGSIRCGLRLARNIIEELPSAQTERKTGHWIKIENPNFNPFGNTFAYLVRCSECGGGNAETKYCSDCGAKMEEEHETDH